MSILHPRVHGGRNSTLRTVASMALTAVVLAACADEPRGITAPRPPRELTVLNKHDPGSVPPDPVGRLVYCDVATLLPSGNYRVRTAPLSVPADIFDGNGATVKVGFRGWAAESSDPTRLAACAIPDTPAAMKWFKTRFAVRDDVPQLFRTAAENRRSRARVIVDGVNAFDGEGTAIAGVCSEMLVLAEGCEEPPSDDPGSPPDEGPPPTDADVPEVPTEVAPDQSVSVPLPPIYCHSANDNPHNSHTFGYLNNVNVHAWDDCTSDMFMLSVTAFLAKQRCFLFFCWWSSRSFAGLPSLPAVAFWKPYVETNHAAPCETGWWLGEGYHIQTPPLGYWPPSLTRWTNRVSKIYSCF